MKNKLKKAGKAVGSYLWKHRSSIMQVSFIAAAIVIPHVMQWPICEASVSKSMPWSQGVNALKDEFTGNLPAIGSTISIATGGALWMFGQSDISKTAMKGAFGTGICLSAPAMVNVLSGKDVSGCLF